MTKNTIRKLQNKKRCEGGSIASIRLRKQISHRYRQTKKLFLSCLKENHYRFNYPLKAKGRVKEEFYFEGIIPNITLFVSYQPLAAFLIYDSVPPLKKDYWDVYDIGYIRDEEDVVNERFDDSRREQYVGRLCDNIILYTNEKFISENSLYLVKYEGGKHTEGFIDATDEADSKEFSNLLEDLKEAEPSIINSEGFHRDNYCEIHKYNPFDKSKYSIRFYQEV